MLVLQPAQEDKDRCAPGSPVLWLALPGYPHAAGSILEPLRYTGSCSSRLRNHRTSEDQGGQPSCLSSRLTHLGCSSIWTPDLAPHRQGEGETSSGRPWHGPGARHVPGRSPAAPGRKERWATDSNSALENLSSILSPKRPE